MKPDLEAKSKALSLQKLMTYQIDQGDSIVQQFYSNVTIFLTGGSGFIGKQLIEKLFRACNIKKMYILIRPKKGTSVQDRLQEILKDPVFDLVSKKHPYFSDRIETLEGDMTSIRLGLEDNQWKRLANEVNVIFHVAATTKLNLPLRMATLTNVNGTREMLALARECSKLKSFVHVSTAYTHTTKDRVNDEIAEEFYPSPVSPDLLIQLVEKMEEGRLNGITKNLLSGWQNTYTFTKAVAEEMIKTSAGDLPVCIVRPPIVVPAYYEPLPGWLDISGVYGATGLFVGTLLSVLRVLLIDKFVRMPLAPVDYVNNVTIVAPWDAAERRRNGDTKIPIYNVIKEESLLSFDFVYTTTIKLADRCLAPRAPWLIFVFNTKNVYLFKVLTWFLHYIPAFALDKIRGILGKNSKGTQSLVQIYKNIEKISILHSFFALNEWSFKNDNINSMIGKMSDVDRSIFNCDLSTIDFQEYILIWGLGIKKYIIKDRSEGTLTPQTKKTLRRIIVCVLTLGIVYLFWKLYKMLS